MQGDLNVPGFDKRGIGNEHEIIAGVIGDGLGLAAAENQAEGRNGAGQKQRMSSHALLLKALHAKGPDAAMAKGPVGLPEA
jgi:hypothetical protein